MSSVEQVVEQNLLYDFYGELLTDHQRKIYEAALFDDFSLSEIAEEAGISRQGVHDLLRRCDKQLRGYEAKLHLVERFTDMKEDVLQIMQLADRGSRSADMSQNDCDKGEKCSESQLSDTDAEDGSLHDTLSEIKRIAGKLMEEL